MLEADRHTTAEGIADILLKDFKGSVRRQRSTHPTVTNLPACLCLFYWNEVCFHSFDDRGLDSKLRLEGNKGIA